MELEVFIDLYTKRTTENEKRSLICNIGLDFLLAKEVVENLESVLDTIDSKYYSILLEAIVEPSNSSIRVAQVLPRLIGKVSYYHLKGLIETLQQYYPSIPVSKYQKLCEKRLSNLCAESTIAADYKLDMNCYCLREIHATKIFRYSLEHYLVDGIIIPRLENPEFSVSFRGKHKKFKDTIHNFVHRLQLEAWEDGLSDEVIYLGEGSYSIVLQIGNQVLKLGKGRKNNELAHSPELINWRYRNYFKENSLFIEVQPLLDMDYIEDEDVARLFISSYKNGCYWSDFKDEIGFRRDNIGRLLSDNLPVRGRLDDNAEEILDYQEPDDVVYQEGDCVIVDTDCYEKLNYNNIEEATIAYRKCLALLGMEENDMNLPDSYKDKVKVRKFK